ncbi:hypothetical protein PAHAL_8G144000 [Panicum hallii]|uniref:Uncharacterized protein n=1 Tax=Panicum hallii TaxID=206008 RepID=A0A2T8I8X0_9POAL|nr:hypothetical protein PAHAL_8G144000 [Panicum hallii]
MTVCGQHNLDDYHLPSDAIIAAQGGNTPRPLGPRPQAWAKILLIALWFSTR